MTAKPTYEELEQRVRALEKSDNKKWKQIQEELRESEKLFRSLYEKAPMAYQSLDKQGRLIKVNQAWLDLLGYTRSEVMGRWFGDFLAPSELGPFAQRFPQFLEQGEVQVDIQMRRKDGSEILVHVHGTIDAEEQDQSFRTHCILSNITAARRAEEARRYERDLIEQMMETSPAGIIRVDAAGRITYANRRAGEILGLPALTGPGWIRTFNDPTWEVTDIDGAPFSEENYPFSIVKKTHEPVFDVRHAIHRDDGRRALLSVNAAPIFDADGAFEGMVATIDDITEKFEAERKYRMLFQEMMDGFALHEILCNGNGVPVDYRFLAVNPAFERLTGLKADTLTGKTVLEVMPNIESSWIETYGRVALTGEPTSFENYSQELDRHFQVRAFRPAPNQFACIFVDITERKELLSRLQQAQKMESIGNLAGGIAHDFNNILFPIVGMSELLLEDLPQGSPEYENIQEIYNAGKRGGDLVKQILAFSRLSERKMIPVHVQQVLKEALKLSRSTIPANIRIDHKIQPDCAMVMADPTQLHQIAMNLITNAYHAVESTGGAIAVSLRESHLATGHSGPASIQPGRYALLTVSDTGCGIDPVLIDKIFDPYFTTKSKEKGTGLGLSVVYGIVREHGGDITVASRPGEGTTFSIFIPLMEKSLHTASRAEKETARRGNERILLVDDEPAIVRIEKQMLSRLGYNVTERTSSIDALETFQSSPHAFDLIISDMTMPNMTGDRLARKAFEIRPDIPVVICTGFSESFNEEKAKAMGIKGFLMKPVIQSELAKMVRGVLDAAKT